MRGNASLYPYPTGWYAVAFGHELAAGEVKTVHYLGQDIVLFRTASGEAVAVPPYCPHLGTHLGHGGVVAGESILCPFHHWRFDASGACVEAPGCAKLPPKAKLAPFPLIEQDGLVFVFHDCEHAEGLRETPREPFAFPPLGLDGYTPNRTVQWRLRSHPQEICENTVDIAHLLPIHSLPEARILEAPVVDGASMRVLLRFTAPGDVIGMPGQDNDVQLEATLHGLGRIVARTHVVNAGVHARQAIYCTPIEGYEMDLRGVVNTKASEDAAFTESLAEMFYDAFVHDFAKDFVIWENKAYLDKPVLSSADGPVGTYRKWARQFSPARDSVKEARAAQPEPAARKPSLIALARDKVRALAQRQRPSPAPPSAVAVQRAVKSSNGAATKSAAPKIGSAREYFDTLDKRFVPSGSKGVDAVFQWKLSGQEPLAFHAIVRNGALELRDGEHQQPTVTIAMTADDYVSMVNGELDGARVFTTGRGKLSGSIPMAIKMRSIFPAS
jgi:nitrite reductase/ring-hydroxylating ferredoxin subunit/putative sterol carrier protein